MGVGDRIENNAEEAKGNVKQGLGEATDNDRLKNDGRADEAKGKVKNAVEDVKDKVTEGLGKLKGDD